MQLLAVSGTSVSGPVHRRPPLSHCPVEVMVPRHHTLASHSDGVLNDAVATRHARPAIL